jgi:hypothetical protein
VNMTMVTGDSDVEAAMPAYILFFPIYNKKNKKRWNAGLLKQHSSSSSRVRSG